VGRKGFALDVVRIDDAQFLTLACPSCGARRHLTAEQAEGAHWVVCPTDGCGFRAGPRDWWATFLEQRASR
jgi:hypothetical protein